MIDRRTDDFLRLAATLEPSPAGDRRLSAEAAHLDWSVVPAAAETHGLVPLLHAHLARVGIDAPPHARQQLAAGALLHRDANRVRFQALIEILDAFDRLAIPVLVLKGAALAHVLYPSSDLRPLSDLDLLVDPGDADRAQAVLAALDFAGSSSQAGRRLVGHHHLPALIRLSGAHRVQVEIHVDGVSRDTPGSLTMRTLRSAPRSFAIGSRSARTLDHADMLYHLCRHAAERAPVFRLIWAADIVGYASKYRDEIPWGDLATRDPFVLNALSLIHMVTPLPDAVLAHVAAAASDQLRGVGVACRPLAHIVTPGRSLAEIGRDIFDPSDWWLRLYYGLDERRSLGWHRRVTHPVQVAWWLTRRAGAYVRWWAASRRR